MGDRLFSYAFRTAGPPGGLDWTTAATERNKRDGSKTGKKAQAHAILLSVTLADQTDERYVLSFLCPPPNGRR